MATIPESFSVTKPLIERTFNSLSEIIPPIAISVMGELTDKSLLNITTDGTFDFGVKPNQQKSLLVWKATEGQSPSNMGQLQVWQGDFSGEPSSVVAGEGSDVSYRQQITSETAASSLPNFLGRVDFVSDQAYVYKRMYNDYSIQDATTFSVPYSNLVGDLPEIGQRVSGETSGASGIIVGFITRDSSDYFVFDPKDSESSVNKSTSDPVYKIFQLDETISWDSGSCQSKGTTSNQREHNDKNNRFWSSSSANNTYTVTGQSGYSPVSVTNEYTGSANYTPEDRHQFIEKEWYDEQIIYSTSDLNVNNGIVHYYRDGVLGRDLSLVTRNTEYPGKYSQFYCDQFTRPSTYGQYFKYSDYFYFDNSHCRVLISNTEDLRLGDAVVNTKYKVIPLPVQSWESNQIRVRYLELLPEWTHLHIINSQNEVVVTVPRGDL